MKLLDRETVRIIELIKLFLILYLAIHTQTNLDHIFSYFIWLSAIKLKAQTFLFTLSIKRKVLWFIFFVNYYGGLSERHLHSLHVSFISAAKSFNGAVTAFDDFIRLHQQHSFQL